MTKHSGSFTLMFLEGVMGNSSTAAGFGLQFYRWRYRGFSSQTVQQHVFPCKPTPGKGCKALCEPPRCSY